jgi:hypothetical protein
MKQLGIAALILAMSGPALAINRCTGLDGKVTYQEAACPTDRASSSIGRPTGVPRVSVVPKEKVAFSSEEDLKRMVMNSLNDPNSAEFKNLQHIEGKALCGQVNAKNSYGGYVGFKAFVADSQGVYWAGDSSTEAEIGSRSAHRTYYPRAHAWGCLPAKR